MESSPNSNAEQEQICARPASISPSLASRRLTSSSSRLISLNDSASQTDTADSEDVNMISGVREQNSIEVAQGPYGSATRVEADFNRNQNNNDRSIRGVEMRDGSVGEGRHPSRGRSQGRHDKEERRSEQPDLALGPRIRGRSQRREMTTAASTISTPPLPSEQTRLSSGRATWSAREVSPRRSVNGLVDFAAFRDTEDLRNDDGSSHRAGSVFLPSATWTPPSLRHFGFPSEFKGFLEVTVMQYLTPWTDKVWNVVKEDAQNMPENWKDIPASRRMVYAVTAFVSGYYLLVSLYAVPLVALGFLAPAYMCREYLESAENEEDNNNNDVNRVLASVKEMSLWMKFWVCFCGWLLASSLAPRIITAILPLKILTLLFVVTSLVAPWNSNPAVLVFDRLLLPLLRRLDGLVESYKEKIILAVSSVEVGNRRRRD